MKRLLLLVVFIWAVSVSAAQAMSFGTEEFVCPVCGESFAASVLRSYSLFDKPSRDLSDHPVFFTAVVHTCPYCLYSAFGCDFGDMPEARRARLRARILDGFQLTLSKEEAEYFRKGPDLMPFHYDSHLGLLIARECNRFIGATDKDGAFLKAKLFFRMRSEPELRAFYLHDAIDAIRAGLDRGAFVGADRAVYTYLHGELLRQAGRPDEALGLFRRARVLAQDTPSTVTCYGEEQSLDWLVKYCDEQSALIRKDAASGKWETGPADFESPVPTPAASKFERLLLRDPPGAVALLRETYARLDAKALNDWYDAYRKAFEVFRDQPALATAFLDGLTTRTVEQDVVFLCARRLAGDASAVPRLAARYRELDDYQSETLILDTLTFFRDPALKTFFTQSLQNRSRLFDLSWDGYVYLEAVRQPGDFELYKEFAKSILVHALAGEDEREREGRLSDRRSIEELAVCLALHGLLERSLAGRVEGD